MEYNETDVFPVDLRAFLLFSFLSSSCASHPERTVLQTGLWIKLRYRDLFFSTDQVLVRECRQVLYFSVFIDYTFEVGCWLDGLNIVLNVASCGHLFKKETRLVFEQRYLFHSGFVGPWFSSLPAIRDLRMSRARSAKLVLADVLPL